MESETESNPTDFEIVYHGFGDNISTEHQNLNTIVISMNTELNKDTNGGSVNESNYRSNQSPSTKPHKRRSDVWDHFKEVQSGDKMVAKCNYCMTKYTISKESHGSTGNLRGHLMKCHKKEYEKSENLAGIQQQCMTRYFSKEKQSNAVFCPKKYRETLIKWIVVSNHLEVEQTTFWNLLQSVNPSITLTSLQISADTVKNDIMKAFQDELLKLKPCLVSAPGKISFTHDIWTSRNQYPFLGVKAHWISFDWKHNELLIGFPNLQGTHSGVNVALAFSSTLEKCGIELSKVFAITTDNATNNDAFFAKFQEYCQINGTDFTEYRNRVRCYAHILNLVVQDLLNHLQVCPKINSLDECHGKSEEISEYEDTILNDSKSFEESKVLIKLRKLVRMIRASPQRREKLRKACELNNIKDNELIIDVKTRWNSTYFMTLRAIQLKIPIFSLCSSEHDMKKDVLAADVWTTLENLQELLQYFERATQHISMSRHTTLTSVVPMFDWLKEKLNLYKQKKSVLSEAASKALEKLEKYFPNPDTNKIIFIAVVLNPSLKLQYFKEHKSWDVKKVKRIVTDEFVRYYEARAESPINGEDEPDDDFLAHMNKRSKQEKKESEINKYLAEATVSSKVDIMDWWKINEPNYPNLANMARNIFSAQSTSVPMEREFSGGSDLVVPTRCSLNPATISASMCLKSWWSAQ